MYDVNFFIKKFEAIPEGNWAIKMLYDPKSSSLYGHGSRCARGHCLSLDLFDLNSGHLKRALSSIDVIEFKALDEVFLSLGNTDRLVVLINNGDYPQYQQPTPKQRILAALYDIKKKENKEWVDKTIESIQPISEKEKEFFIGK